MFHASASCNVGATLLQCSLTFFCVQTVSLMASKTLKNDGIGKDSGHVRVYQFNGPGNPWIQLGLDIDGEASGDNSGYSVALSSDGTRVAITAPGVSMCVPYLNF